MTHQQPPAKKIEGKQVQIPTAFSSHKQCFICKKSKQLHTVKPESIINAYLNHGIIIKHHARCCDDHLDNVGLLKPDEINDMPTNLKSYPNDLIILVDHLKAKINFNMQSTCGIFDKFKDMASLDEILCIKITGWTKLQFVNFSKLIENVKDTNGRTKDQLIAIYRYWLSKGLDQSTLAMLKTDTTQQQISHYLSQIRVAINNEFVPLYLGADKGKDFFLKHNTDSVKVLHQMKDDELAVIVDGTYTRLQKSSNNDFQYQSYSMHKHYNLIKPFIICCADGYFIDCYGPFDAKPNDAQILRYILKTDKDLVDLLTPADKIRLFVDRGKYSFILV
jgi:hypothetical protein